MREVKGAIFNTEELIEVDRKMVEFLKQRASQSKLLRFRLCLHHSPESPVQEMIIAACCDNYSRPHRHPGRSMTYQMIEGELTVFIFDQAGNVSQKIEMGPPSSGKSFCFRLSSGGWYMPVVRSEVAVYQETLSGPNQDGQATEYADWSPEVNDAEGITTFLRKLMGQQT
jgi:cupin fold WbuC family metalloprotein